MKSISHHPMSKRGRSQPPALFRFISVFTLFLVVFFYFARSAYPADVSLVWDPVIHPDLAGYKMFYREKSESYDYQDPVWTGTETTCTVFALDDYTSYCFVVRAFDTFGNESDDSNEVCWSPTLASNNPPVLHDIGSKSIEEGALLTFTVTGSDPDGDGLSFSASNVPTGASFNPSTRVFSWTPASGDAGNYNVTFTVTDDGTPAESDSEVVSITVGNVNRPPVLGAIGSKSVNEGDLLSFTINASDPDGDILSYSASNIPSGANFDSGTRTFSWTPTTGDAGDYKVQFTVTDSGSPPESDLEIVNITVVHPSIDNLAPDQPVITSPYHGEIEADLLLTVETGPFSDPDGDTHKESRWQIVKKQDSSVILDITSSSHLTELTVPHTVLDRNTTYSVSVQFYDSYSAASEWSNQIEFTTTSNIVDFDGDGIPDDREVDDSVDLNGDGIPDNDQGEVIKSVQTTAAGRVAVGVCKDSVNIDEIEVLETLHPSSILDRKNKPQRFAFGLFSYRVRVNQPGDTATVRIYYSEDISGTKFFYMYDSIKGWRDYTQHATFNADGRSVTVELRDGANGDSDGVANGIIVDPGGVVDVAAIRGLDIGIGGGCLIDTAAFGPKPFSNLALLLLISTILVCLTSLKRRCNK